MRLFFRDAKFRQAVQDLVSLDFQLPRQLVDSNLLHRENNLLFPYRRSFPVTAPMSGLLAATFRGALFRFGPFGAFTFGRIVSGGTRAFYRTKLFRRRFVN